MLCDYKGTQTHNNLGTVHRSRQPLREKGGSQKKLTKVNQNLFSGEQGNQKLTSTQYEIMYDIIN